MNERMLELYRQAWMPYTAIDPSNNMPYETTTFSAEKFAELIVLECAEICKKQEYDYWRSSEDQDFTPQDCADAIEQHFGVSE